MDQSRTVVEAKTAFLRQQIRLLSATLQPSSQWRDNAPAIEEPELSDKVVEDVMNKGWLICKSNKRLYAENWLKLLLPSFLMSFS